MAIRGEPSSPSNVRYRSVLTDCTSWAVSLSALPLSLQVLVLPHRAHLNHLLDFTPEQVQTFASILGEVTLRYDNLFECSFPYSMGMHQRPVPPRRNQELTAGVSPTASEGKDKERQWDEAQFHVHFYPPLLRSKTVKKFQVSVQTLPAEVATSQMLIAARPFSPAEQVGFEMLGEPQRDLTAEQAAKQLREVDATQHYTARLAST